MTKTRLAGLLAGAALLAGSALPASAADLWEAWPVVGGGAYCDSFTTGVQTSTTVLLPNGTSYTMPTGQICTALAPAGPTVFTGNENVPVGLGPLGQVSSNGGAQEALVPLPVLGQGPMVDQTTVGTAQTIPNNTPFFFLDGVQASALTVTMPLNPVEGQIQRIVCTAATVGVLTVAANTSVVTQVLKNNPAAACTAGVGYAWRYQASNLTWYRFN